MKILKKLGVIMAVSLAISLVVPNVVPVMNTMVEAKDLYLDKWKPEKPMYVYLNEGEQSKVTYRKAKSKIKWVIKDESIATVDSKGIVTGIKRGVTTLTVTIGKLKYNCEVTVRPIIFSSKLHYLFLEEQLQLGVKKCELPITWESEEESIATVDKDGMITGKTTGKTNINAIINDRKYPYAITVEDPKILPNLTVTRGKEYDLDLSTIITGTERKDIWWSSEERNVYLIDGFLTPRDPGTDVITAHFGVGSGGRTLSCNVTIY